MTDDQTEGEPGFRWLGRVTVDMQLHIIASTREVMITVRDQKGLQPVHVTAVGQPKTYETWRDFVLRERENTG